MHISSTDRPKERQVPSGTMHGPSGLMHRSFARCKSDKPKGVGFGKMTYNAHADHLEA
jgi:hypothetical protein